jgi:hypothetical protein
MTQFVINIDNAASLAGISSAREAYNQALPQTVSNELGEQVPNPNLIGSDEAYVSFVMQRAAESYAKQYEHTV